jgi:hypothetical protein
MTEHASIPEPDPDEEAGATAPSASEESAAEPDQPQLTQNFGMVIAPNSQFGIVNHR